MLAPDTSRISPTAHYTAYVWHRHGMSTPELATRKGRALFYALQSANRALAITGRADMESLLLARHRVIDHLLQQAIDRGEVGQIVEIAAGLSPRGLRMRRRYPHITYVECDLADMVATKRGLLGDKLDLDSLHRVETVNALAEEGPGSLAALADTLDTQQGVAVITEGLLPYFDAPTGSQIWRTIGHFMRRFRHGLYLSDYYLRADSKQVLGARAMTKLLSWFVDGSMHMPHCDSEALRQALAQSGLEDATIHMAGDFAEMLHIESPKRSAYVRVIEAHT